MSGFARRLKLRLFLEGVEIPIIGAQVQAQPNSPAMATIQIPPLSEATRFFPRTLVHVFFLDFYEVDSPLLRDATTAAAATANGTASPTSFERSALRAVKDDGSFDQTFINEIGKADLHNESYKLLFTGELIGWQWSKNASNRSLVLQCQDLSNYWDYAFQWSNRDLFGPGMKAVFSGGSTNMFTDFLSSESEDLIRTLNTPSLQYPGLKGLLGGVVHLLESIGGSFTQDKSISGQNIFFTLAELRLHITQMITAFPDDKTASSLLNLSGFDGLMGRTLGNLGQQVSFRQAINALMGIIFYESYPQPCPMYVPGTSGTVSGSVRKSAKDDPTNSFVAVTASSLIASITDIQTDVSAVASISTAGFAGAKTSLLTRVGQAKKTCRETQLRITAKEIAAAQSFYGAAQTALGTAETKIKSKLIQGSASASDEINSQLDQAKAQLQKAADFEINTTAKGKAIPARLNNQIFRPDIWFSAPPRCNVIFPDQYSQLQYTRMFLQEPTRLLLKTSDSFFGEDELFDNFYFAPKALTVKSGKNTLQAVLTNDVLDHELFTGILPVFEKMGELNIFAARSGTQDGKTPKVGLAQRSTNFLYFKYRFAARQMQISGRFNPYVAVGFPGLVIDKYVDIDSLRRYNELAAAVGQPTRDINKLLGTHFLGSFTQVSHNVDQSRGTTDITMSYPRLPDESVEFLGAVQGESTSVMKKQDKTALRRTDVAALFAPRARMVGPNLGSIVGVTDVTQKYRATDITSAQTLPLFGGPRSGTSLKVQVPVGLAVRAGDLGADVVAFIGDENLIVTFRAYTVEEDTPQYKKEDVDLPPEEYIRPGWYGDVWHPSKISETYKYFFNIGAITEPQQITQPNGASTGTTSSDAQSAVNDQAQATGTDDPRAQLPASVSLAQNASIEQAVAFLALAYSIVKTGSLDIEEFIRAYTWRPIATMVDMFGTSDLQLSTDGTKVVSGIEGFHSRAFGPFEDLFGLVTSDIENIVGIKRGSTVSQKGDTRKRKQDAVKEYLAAIQFARAIIG